MSTDREKTMTITEFLEARIAEDEATVAYPAEHERAGGYRYVDVGGLSDILTVGTDRVLAECAAKRAIVATHGPDGSPWHEVYCATCADWDCSEMGEGPPALPFPCDTLKHVAAVYSDHPDYQQEWAIG